MSRNRFPSIEARLLMHWQRCRAGRMRTVWRRRVFVDRGKYTCILRDKYPGKSFSRKNSGEEFPSTKGEANCQWHPNSGNMKELIHISSLEAQILPPKPSKTQNIIQNCTQWKSKSLPRSNQSPLAIWKSLYIILPHSPATEILYQRHKNSEAVLCTKRLGKRLTS